MAETVAAKKPVTEQVPVGRYGLGIAIIGALFVLVDGIAVLAMNSVIAPSLGGPRSWAGVK